VPQVIGSVADADDGASRVARLTFVGQVRYWDSVLTRR
jgi:hypothetical protein